MTAAATETRESAVIRMTVDATETLANEATRAAGALSVAAATEILVNAVTRTTGAAQRPGTATRTIVAVLLQGMATLGDAETLMTAAAPPRGTATFEDAR